MRGVNHSGMIALASLPYACLGLGENPRGTEAVEAVEDAGGDEESGIEDGDDSRIAALL